jgi:cytoskeleton protein RodZ
MNNNEHPDTNDINKPKSGRILQEAREQQGLTQQQVAQRLRLRLSTIQALEASESEKNVSPTFTRGYIKLYAKLLGIDAQPLLKDFEALNSQSTQQDAKLQSFSRRVAREANDSRWNLVTYVIVALVIGSVVLWWIDQSDFSLSSAIDTNTTQATEQDSQQSESLSLEQDTIAVNSSVDFVGDVSGDTSDINDTEIDNTAAPQILEELARNAVNEDELAQEQDEEQETPTATSNPQVESFSEFTADVSNEYPYEVNADGTVDMVFTFADDCWVSVKDVDGETIAIGVKVKGRVMEVSGIPPIEVILGAPGVVDITFGGQTVNVSQFPSTRTANFQLPLQGE